MNREHSELGNIPNACIIPAFIKILQVTYKNSLFEDTLLSMNYICLDIIIHLWYRLNSQALLGYHYIVCYNIRARVI